MPSYQLKLFIHTRDSIRYIILRKKSFPEFLTPCALAWLSSSPGPCFHCHPGNSFSKLNLFSLPHVFFPVYILIFTEQVLQQLPFEKEQERGKVLKTITLKSLIPSLHRQFGQVQNYNWILFSFIVFKRLLHFQSLLLPLRNLEPLWIFFM